ncbi:hypothetical protein CPB86DRAFT_714560 [Serendipita vermifera]|nr:hypothetical protein CPB86DRAFT_714560 [Serendipita vermifera]
MTLETDGFHRKVHERLLNTVCDIYMLPDDPEEDARLKGETKVLEVCLANVYAKVDEWLNSKATSSTTSCLDIGSARGDWYAVDHTAARCQQSQFLGIDLCPHRRPETALGPPRASFEVHDVNAGLERFQQGFDVLHARNLAQGIQRFSSFILEAAETLRPGGLGVFIEWDYQVYNASKIPYTCSSPNYDPSSSSSFPGFGQASRPQTEQVPALVNFLRSVTRSSTAAGSHISSVSHLGAFVQRSNQFKDVEINDVWVPVVPKPGADATERKIANDFRPYFVGFLSSCAPLLLSYGGFTHGQLSAIEDAARIEVMACKVPLYVRFICVTAVRKAE